MKYENRNDYLNRSFINGMVCLGVLIPTLFLVPPILGEYLAKRDQKNINGYQTPVTQQEISEAQELRNLRLENRGERN